MNISKKNKRKSLGQHRFFFISFQCASSHKMQHHCKDKNHYVLVDKKLCAQGYNGEGAADVRVVHMFCFRKNIFLSSDLVGKYCFLESSSLFRL